FPYRLTSEVTLLSALLLGGFAAHPLKPHVFRGQVSRLAIAGSVLGVLSLGLILATSLGQLPRTHAEISENRVNLPMLWRLEFDRELLQTNTGGDYLPRSVQGNFFADARQPVSAQPDGTGPRVTLVGTGPLSLIAQVEANRPTSVVFDWLAYRAWHATLDGTPAAIKPSGPLGLIQIPVPAGTHTLRLAASGTELDRFGLGLSALAALFALLIVLRKMGPARVRVLVAAAVLSLGGVAGVAAQIQPARGLVAGVDFTRNGMPEIRLVGSRWNVANQTPTGALDLTLFWQATTASPADCTVHLRVLDASGQVIARRDKAPLFGLRPCQNWQSGEVVRDEEQIRLPSGTPAGTYRVALGLSLAGEPLAPTTEQAPIVTWHDPQSTSQTIDSGILLGKLLIGTAPVDAEPLTLEPVGANVADLFSLDADQVVANSADGRSLAKPTDSRFVARAAPGGSLAVDLLWRSLADTSTDYSVFTQLLDANQVRVAQDDAWPDRFSFPTSVWFPGDRRHDRYDLQLSPTLKPGIYTLVAGMYARPSLRRLLLRGSQAGQDHVTLGTVKVSAQNQVFGTPAPVAARDDNLGGEIALTGAQIEPLATGRLVVDLRWQAVVRPRTGYTAFVHVIDRQGRLVAQHDSPPLNGAYPTQFWDPGDTVDDRVTIQLPNSLPPGSYQVVVGLYQAPLGVRLVTTSGLNAIPIGDFAVGSPP
ncbi:MAG TPA: hypothetical protein VMW65_05160, partial [Chloroflexota bacterium]|nr:hypothetical protein [Chloroflexota bacterium]